MIGHNLFVWNVRGLNSRARRDGVREFIAQERVSVVCLVETKLTALQPCMLSELMGVAFDYVCLPSEGAAGGIIVAWCRDAWLGSGQVCRRFSVSVNLKATNSASAPWTAPSTTASKGTFLMSCGQK
jgi:hypothetical protein